MESKKMSAKDKQNLIILAGRKICGFIGFDSHSLAIYPTSYGLSIDSLRGTSPLVKTVQNILDEYGIKYKISSGVFHDEIRISTRIANLEKYKELGNECWAKACAVDVPKFKEYLKLASQVDISNPHNIKPYANCVMLLKSGAESRVKYYKSSFQWFNVDSEIRELKIFLPFQNHLIRCQAYIKNSNNKPLKERNIHVEVLVKDEIVRLTGKTE